MKNNIVASKISRIIRTVKSDKGATKNIPMSMLIIQLGNMHVQIPRTSVDSVTRC